MKNCFSCKYKDKNKCDFFKTISELENYLPYIYTQIEDIIRMQFNCEDYEVED